jgi:PTH1 family peptidyl-tRNA hydrolase
MCLNYLARTHGIKFDKRKAKARIGSGEIAGSKVILARPQTYMNRSGESVSLLVRKFDTLTSPWVKSASAMVAAPGDIRE